MSFETDIQTRLATVRARIARAAEAARRDPAAIRLVAVSKTFGAASVRAAADAGQVDFGENRVQEALDKISQLAPGAAAGQATPSATSSGLQWHLVGHLQANKARKAAASFAFIHSIDSVDLLQRVDRAAEEAGTSPHLLVQADLAGEPTKHGARADELEAIFRAADACRAARVVGLMLLPPFFDDPEGARPYFRRLAALRDTLATRGVPPARLAELSMGMSHDFEAAIQEGATIVRVGTAIFGARPSKEL